MASNLKVRTQQKVVKIKIWKKKGWFTRGNENQIKEENKSIDLPRDVLDSSDFDCDKIVRHVPDFTELSSSSKMQDTLKEKLTRSKVSEFFATFCPTMLSEDVLKNKSFIESISENVNSIRNYLSLRDSYEKEKSRNFKSQLASINKDLKSKLTNLVNLMEETGNIKIDVAQGLQTLSLTVAMKNNKLSNITASIASLAAEIKSSNIMQKIKKRTRQIQLEREKKETAFLKANTKVSCFNSNLKWEEAFLSFEEKRIDCHINISKSEIKTLASHIENECFVDSDYVGSDKESKIKVLLRYFPIMAVTRYNKILLINISEFVLDPLSFFTLLEDKPIPAEINENHTEPPPPQRDITFGPKQKLGRKPIYIKFPAIVECATNFIKEHSFAAHGRRRETTVTGLV